jgi:CRISPR-associated protein Cas2
VVVIYVIIVYDIAVERVNKVKIFLRQYLKWIQNSVFEGELTESELRYVERSLKKIINERSDHVVAYVLSDKKFLNRDEFGIPKLDVSNVI